MSDYIIGLTGGVASGKSAVEKRFRAMGVTVADADAAARAAVAPGSPGLAEVVASFGTDVLAADGSLDRAGMRRRVFNDPTARTRLEAIVHPIVRSTLAAACSAAAGVYAIASIPLLAEGGGRTPYPWLERILVVDTPEAMRQERLMRRDGIDAGLARTMIAAQATREARLAIADDVLINDKNEADLDTHVAALDRLYRRLAAAHSARPPVAASR